MTLAIKRVHNLPPHVSCVSTPPDITQKLKRDTDELKQSFSDIWDRIPQGIIDEAIDQWQTRLSACVNAKGRHFEHLCDLATQPALFRATSDALKPVLFRATHTTERKTT